MSDVNLSELKDKLMALLEDEHQVKILEWWDKIFHFFFGDNPELSRFHRLYLIADRNSDGSVTFLLLLATLVVYALGVLIYIRVFHHFRHYHPLIFAILFFILVCLFRVTVMERLALMLI